MTVSSARLYWLGVDLAKDSFDVALAPMVIDRLNWRELDGEHFDCSKAGRGKLLIWLQLHLRPVTQLAGIVVESTGKMSKRFALDLAREFPLLPQVVIANPKHIKDYGRCLGVRDKNDRVDAAVIALFGAHRQPKAKVSASPAFEELREMMRLRAGFVVQRDANRNRLPESESRAVRLSLQKVNKAIEREITGLEEQALEVVKGKAELKRDYNLLVSIAGIGRIGALTLLGEMGDLREYTRSQLVAAVGMYPRQFVSGSSVFKNPRLVKGAGAEVRRVLFNCARSLFSSKNNSLKRYLEKQQERGKSNKECLIAAMRKQLLIARRVLIDEEKYDPNFN